MVLFSILLIPLEGTASGGASSVWAVVPFKPDKSRWVSGSERASGGYWRAELVSMVLVLLDNVIQYWVQRLLCSCTYAVGGIMMTLEW